MHQSKIESLLETFLNIASGFVVSMLLWAYVVAPLWGLEMTTYDNFGIVAIFTISAVIRGYVWRRFFNKGIHKTIHSAVKSWYA